MKRSYLCLSVPCAAALLGLPALAEPGETQDATVSGRVAALEGPARYAGMNFAMGLLAAFEEANSAGGARAGSPGAKEESGPGTMQLANSPLAPALPIRFSLPSLTALVCKNRGIQCKLLFGFAIITCFTFLATSVAFFSCKSLANKLYQIESESLPPIMELLAISQRASALAAMSANIARASAGAELERAMGFATEFRSGMIANLAAIRVHREDAGELKSAAVADRRPCLQLGLARKCNRRAYRHALQEAVAGRRSGQGAPENP